jgi:putative heme-binding domain-containing protein
MGANVLFAPGQFRNARPGRGRSREKCEQIFFVKGQCARCRMVMGRMGPDLTPVGAGRSVAYLTESIREPDKELSLGITDPHNHYVIPMEYEAVTVRTRDGGSIIGVAKNEDAFSIQLLGQDDERHLFLKKGLREVVHERRCLMQAYSEQILDRAELQDLLSYLTNLRGV